MPEPPSRALETVPNPAPDRVYRVRLVAPEFTCLCPRTGQPDFATLQIEYVPGPWLIELKSLKLYLWSFRGEGMFHEAVVNRVLDDLDAAAAPVWVQVTGFFRIRGGITTAVTSSRGELPPGCPPVPDLAPETAP